MGRKQGGELVAKEKPRPFDRGLPVPQHGSRDRSRGNWCSIAAPLETMSGCGAGRHHI